MKNGIAFSAEEGNVPAPDFLFVLPKRKDSLKLDGKTPFLYSPLPGCETAGEINAAEEADGEIDKRNARIYNHCMKRNIAVKLAVLLGGVLVLAVICYTGIQCVFLYFFHVICPGCGMSRALIACWNLDFVSAFRCHPMVFSLPVLFLYFWKDGKLFKNKTVNALVLGVIILGFLANYIFNLIRLY